MDDTEPRRILPLTLVRLNALNGAPILINATDIEIADGKASVYAHSWIIHIRRPRQGTEPSGLATFTGIEEEFAELEGVSTGAPIDAELADVV